MTMTTTPFLSHKRRRAFQRTPPHFLLGKCEATTPKMRGMIMSILVDEAPSDARVVVGSVDVFVHFHEAGMGLLVGFRLIDPSLAILAIDRQALRLTKLPQINSWPSKSINQACVAFAFASSSSSLFCERKLVVVMVIHSLILRSPPSLLGDGRGGGHGHTQPSF